jgi:hypothetical protein
MIPEALLIRTLVGPVGCINSIYVNRSLFRRGVPIEKSIWHPERELNGVDHRLASSRGAAGGITPTRSIAVGVDLTEHAKAVRQLAH